MTINELKEKLQRLDEVLILEVLDISAEELVERFEDLVELKYDLLVEELNDGYRSDDGHGE